MVERYPNLKEEVGGSIPNCEISSLLDRILPCGQVPHMLWRWLVGPLSKKKIKKEEEEASGYSDDCVFYKFGDFFICQEQPSFDTKGFMG